jgi:hypothetical protein
LAAGAGLSILGIRDRGECQWDLASLAEIMPCLDPGKAGSPLPEPPHALR